MHSSQNPFHCVIVRLVLASCVSVGKASCKLMIEGLVVIQMSEMSLGKTFKHYCLQWGLSVYMSAWLTLVKHFAVP